MATYKDLQAQIAQLQKEAQEARDREVDDAIAQIQTLMNELGIAASDLEDRALKRGKKPQTKAGVKFRSGEKTWSGRGRLPLWLKGEDKEKYRVG